MEKAIACFILALALVVSNFAGLDIGVEALHADEPGTMQGAGTEQNPYVITNYAQLKEFADIVNGTGIYVDNANSGVCAILGADIECNDKTWIPIGSDSHPYTGTFDGKHHKIIGLNNTGFDDISTKDNQGLFGVNSGTIKNVGVVDGEIKGKSYVGGIVGYIAGNGSGIEINVINCYNTGSISGITRVGGVVGSSYIVGSSVNMNISKCYNMGTVRGSAFVGGVVGSNYVHGNEINESTKEELARIEYCYNIGSVYGDGENIGGVVGENFSKYKGAIADVRNCYNKGNVGSTTSPGNYIGGVVGYNMADSSGEANICNCYNMGILTGNYYVGGVVGSNYTNNVNAKVTITNCYNTGAVSGSSYIGGVIGRIHKENYDSTASVSNCYYNIDTCHVDDAVAYNDDSATINSVKPLTTLQMTGTDALGEDGMLFDGNSAFIAKADGTYGENYYWYYPHLKGFNFKVFVDNGNSQLVQMLPEDITADNWPAKVKGELTWSVAAQDKTYDGSELKPVVSSIALKSNDDSTFKTLKANTDYSMAYKMSVGSGYVDVESPTDTGDYKTFILMETIDNGNTVKYYRDVNGDFTISKKSASLSAEPASISSLVYDGTSKNLVTGGTVDEGITIYYALSEDNITAPIPDDAGATEKRWKTTIPSAKNAGTYHVWYKAEVDKNYSSTVSTEPKCITVSIERAGVTVKANDTGKTYGTDDPKLTATVTGIVEGESTDLINYSVSRTNGEDAGTYTIVTAGDAVQGNYIVTFETGTFTIAKKLAGIKEVPVAVGSLVYNGTTQDLIKAGTAEEGLTIYYAVGTDSVTAPAPDAEDAADKKWSTEVPVVKNAGTYYIWYKAIESKNYDPGKFADAVCIPVSIGQAEVTVKADDAGKKAGEVDPALTAVITGLIEGESADLIKYSVSRTAGEDEGTYTITPAGDESQGNYKVKYVTGTFTLSKADPENIVPVNNDQDTNQDLVNDGNTGNDSGNGSDTGNNSGYIGGNTSNNNDSGSYSGTGEAAGGSNNSGSSGGYSSGGTSGGNGSVTTGGNGSGNTAGSGAGNKTDSGSGSKTGGESGSGEKNGTNSGSGALTGDSDVIVKENKDGTTTETTKTENEDGSTTEISKTTDKDGNVIKTVTVTEETKDNGKKVTTTSTDNADGSSEKITKVVNTNGSTEIVEKKIKVNGDFKIKTVDTNKKGIITKTVTETKSTNVKTGNITLKTETIKKSGATETSKIVTKPDGNLTKASVTETTASGKTATVELKTDKNGDVTVKNIDSSKSTVTIPDSIVDAEGGIRAVKAISANILSQDSNVKTLKVGKNVEVFRKNALIGSGVKTIELSCVPKFEKNSLKTNKKLTIIVNSKKAQKSVKNQLAKAGAPNAKIKITKSK